MKRKQKHICRLPDRVIKVVVREKPDAVFFEIAFSLAGPFPNEQDHRRFKEWLWKIVYPYDADPRPSVFINAATGEVATVVAPPDGPGLDELPAYL